MTKYEHLLNQYTACIELAEKAAEKGDTNEYRAMLNCAEGFQRKMMKLTLEEAGESA